jgi:HAD superfamily hydrolase (TIGR01509 family)
MFRKPVKAALFDMDGLLIDSEAVYIVAMQAAARHFKREMTLDFCHSMVGIPRAECNVMLQELYGEGFDLAEFRGVYSANVQQAMAAGVPVKAGVVDVLALLAERGVPCGVATSALREVAESHLARAGLRQHFATLVARDDVERAKPFPDIYLEAARRIGVPPENCLAFEDSSPGLTAAHAAGTMAIMVPDILQPSDEIKAKAFHVAPDMVAVERLLREHLVK